MIPVVLPSIPKSSFNKILFVGDFPEKDDLALGQPFTGRAGQELGKLLSEVGIVRSQSAFTFVFREAPDAFKIENFCGKKAEVGGKDYTLPPLSMGKYFRPEYLHYLDKLRETIAIAEPNLIVALGAVPCWALLSDPKIGKLRGAIASFEGTKVLPTYSPQAVAFKYSFRTVLKTDLIKAKREATFPEIRCPEYNIWLPEDLHDVEYIRKLLCAAPEFALDIETRAGQITCIGFSPDGRNSYVIPIATKTPPFRYWSAKDEPVVRHSIKSILDCPAQKSGQNGVYDLQYCWREGMPVRNYSDDTMLLHHAMYPEMPKGLGFLGATYTNAPSWKEMRTKETEDKADA
tara:strand:- start:24984 stop:26021 length:1038 start_codon:yes stop_codon:yes gene_type:complete